MSLTIADLQLAPIAATGARMLKAEYGEAIQFVSGYRSLWEQAEAMAQNTLHCRTWIGDTYTRKGRPSYTIAQSLQRLVEAHPEWRTQEDLHRGLYEELDAIYEGHLISRHCHAINGRPASLAFDLSPAQLETATGSLTTVGCAVWRSLWALPGIDGVLRREGGLVRWHVQFMPPLTVEV
jgi:hypothetical protein